MYSSVTLIFRYAADQASSEEGAAAVAANQAPSEISAAAAADQAPSESAAAAAASQASLESIVAAADQEEDPAPLRARLAKAGIVVELETPVTAAGDAGEDGEEPAAAAPAPKKKRLLLSSARISRDVKSHPLLPSGCNGKPGCYYSCSDAISEEQRLVINCQFWSMTKELRSAWHRCMVVKKLKKTSKAVLEGCRL